MCACHISNTRGMHLALLMTIFLRENIERLICEKVVVCKQLSIRCSITFISAKHVQFLNQLLIIQRLPLSFRQFIPFLYLCRSENREHDERGALSDDSDPEDYSPSCHSVL